MCKNQKGFTLVELLVVVAIIGVLAAVAVPRMSGMTDNAKKAKILADLKIINNAMDVYCAQNGQYPYNDQWARTLNNSHILVTSGVLPSAPTPPTGPLDGLPAVMEYRTEGNNSTATTDAQQAYISGVNSSWPYWSLRYLKDTKHW